MRVIHRISRPPQRQNQGHTVRGTDWSCEHIPDLQGKVFVVTGGNAGIGLATVQALAGKRARVVMASRSEARAQAAVQALKAGQRDADISALPLDLASLASVHAFAERLRTLTPTLDGLINNAGVMMTPQARTADGFELQFGTNVLGHFALTGLLLPQLKATPGSRVVTVSSVGHWFGKLDFDNLGAEKGYSAMMAYAQTKFANLVFALELQRRLQRARIDTISLGAHPGVTHSDLGRHAGWVAFVMRIYGQTTAQGALPSLRAATDPQVRGGDYIGPGGLLTFKGSPTPQASRRLAHDPQLGERLWDAAQQLTGLRYL